MKLIDSHAATLRGMALLLLGRDGVEDPIVQALCAGADAIEATRDGAILTTCANTVRLGDS